MGRYCNGIAQGGYSIDGKQSAVNLPSVSGLQQTSSALEPCGLTDSQEVKEVKNKTLSDFS